MNCTSESLDQELCGCCTGIARETPEAITNRPALSSVGYRAGRYATFNASLLAALSAAQYAPLASLRTRDGADFSIALLDAWATTLDILTFYQERFANEAFLRTAIDQRSVFELARLVGYRPSPGVAASAVLAFTLSSAPGSPDTVPIPAATRVQSVPDPGGQPQTFETSADLNATIANNALPAQTTTEWQLLRSDTSTWVAGTTNNINSGDALLFIVAQASVPSNTGPADVHFVTSVTLDSTANVTQIFWNQSLSSEFPAQMTADTVSIYVFRKKAALYGVQAPSPLTLAGPNVPLLPGYPNPVTKGSDWQFIYDDYSYQVNLDASYPGVVPSQDGASQWLVLTGLGYTSVFLISQAAESNPHNYTLTNKTTQLTLVDGAGEILTGDKGLSTNEVLYLFVQETRNITAYVQSALLTPASLPLTAWDMDTTYSKETGMLAPVEGTAIAVVGGQQLANGQPIGISGRRVRLQVTEGSAATFVPAGSSGALTVADNQAFLVDSFPPLADPGSGNPMWQVLTTTGVAGVLSVTNDNMQLVPADGHDAIVGEAASVQSVTVLGNITSIGLAAPLTRIYDVPSASVNANAVLATHGETVQEILGSGDATNPALQFSLKQSPLTYTAAPAGDGTQSTLQVWVNSLRWQEEENLLAAGPADRVFVTRVNPAGSRLVQFGNGVQGGRPGTGQSNIRATYRKGIGLAGMVKAGQLSQPLDRPQGLKYVTNPSAASGGADPASADDARASAPLPTLTIGRVVSLEDYQNYALAFTGIAKAMASWAWFGGTRGVFLTIAGEGGSILLPDDLIVTSLVSALMACGSPRVPLQVASFVPVLFQFAAQVAVDQTDYDPKLVLAQVWQNVSSSFAFDQRQLGQPVVASSIVETIQQTPGVIALQLQGLYRSGDTAAWPIPTMICASGPLPPQGAQMLLLDPATQGNIGVWS